MSNKGRSYGFRNEVLLALHEAGFVTAKKTPETKGLPTEQRIRGDIVGLPMTMGIRCQVNLDLATALREVQAEAQAEGNDVFASVQFRRGHPVQSAYVTTTLSVWLEMLARLHPEIVTHGTKAQARAGAR